MPNLCGAVDRWLVVRGLGSSVSPEAASRATGKGRRFSCVVFGVLVAVSVASDSVRSAPPLGNRGGVLGSRIVDFAPGVRIDWSSRVVEVSAKVVLRGGPLELLACAPQTREHESVLVVSARPLHIFQAIGLLGAEPGRPPTYDDASQRVIPASGEPVSIAVRFGTGQDARQVPARELLRLADGETPAPLKWVFSGSRRLSDGGLAADIEGTVACVVDFPSALVSLDHSHSADNDQLWLSANTPKIPPVGTPCTLLIGVRSGRTIVLSVDAEGRLWRGSELITPAKAAAVLAKEPLGTGIEIVPRGEATPSSVVVEAAIHAVVAAGADSSRITTHLKRAGKPLTPVGKPHQMRSFRGG